MKSDRTRPNRFVATAVSVLAGSALTIGCTSTSTTSTAATTTTNPSAASTATTALAKAPGSTAPTTAKAAKVEAKTYEVTGSDYKFEGLPAEVAVGSELKLKNASDREVHEMVVFKLPASETRTATQLAALPMGELMGILAGPPALVVVAPPHAPGFNAVGDGKVAAPGRYLVMCSIPTGADPQAYLAAAQASKGGPISVPGGAPHHTVGMIAELTAA